MPQSDRPATTGGEKPVHREAMEQMRATLIQNGNAPRDAEKIARNAALRHERNNR